ncbi:unnamed protein product, partial [Mesorhabditis belari]|uniref:Uncharacterized protein n=1 Tax=Mesorhabditis belari TaxID=2138241 RepID=A0AAF3FEE3_9BILA
MPLPFTLIAHASAFSVAFCWLDAERKREPIPEAPPSPPEPSNKSTITDHKTQRRCRPKPEGILEKNLADSLPAGTGPKATAERGMAGIHDPNYQTFNVVGGDAFGNDKKAAEGPKAPAQRWSCW